VDVPTKLAELEKLHDPPEVKVEVTRRTKRAGAAPCHSAVCLIIAPIIIAEALFPKKYDEVVVTRDGEETYRGTFRTDGDLIQASVRDGDKLKVVRALLLKQLDRKVIVEVSRARVDDEGKVVGQEPVSIQSQVDLVGAYDKAMSKKNQARQRAGLLREALMHLGEEAMGLASKRLAAERDPERAEVLENICGLKVVRKNREKVLDLVKKAGGAVTARAVLGRCKPSLKPDRATTEAMLSLLVEATCDGSCGMHASTLGRWNSMQEYREFLNKAVGACKDEHGRAVLRLILGQELPVKDLERVLTTGTNQNRRCVARALDLRRPGHLKLIAAGLKNKPKPLLHQDLMVALSNKKGPLSRSTMEAVLAGYLLPGRRLLAAGHALKRFHEVKDPKLRKRLRARVEKALARAHKDDRTALGAALVALGKHDAALAAVKAARSDRTITLMFPTEPKLINRPVKLVAYVLKLKGCDNNAIGRALKAADRGEKVKPSLCL